MLHLGGNKIIQIMKSWFVRFIVLLNGEALKWRNVFMNTVAAGHLCGLKSHTVPRFTSSTLFVNHAKTAPSYYIELSRIWF